MEKTLIKLMPQIIRNYNFSAKWSVSKATLTLFIFLWQDYVFSENYKCINCYDRVVFYVIIVSSAGCATINDYTWTHNMRTCWPV